MNKLKRSQSQHDDELCYFTCGNNAQNRIEAGALNNNKTNAETSTTDTDKEYSENLWNNEKNWGIFWAILDISQKLQSPSLKATIRSRKKFLLKLE